MTLQTLGLDRLKGDLATSKQEGAPGRISDAGQSSEEKMWLRVSVRFEMSKRFY